MSTQPQVLLVIGREPTPEEYARHRNIFVLEGDYDADSVQVRTEKENWPGLFKVAR